MVGMSKMTLEIKLKKALLTVAVDKIIKGADQSPERCVRSLIELGEKAFPNRLNASQMKDLHKSMLMLCKKNELDQMKDSLFKSFNP